MAHRLSLYEQVLATIESHGLADANTPVLCMVSGGSDSTALAYLCKQMCDDGLLGGFAIMHVDHKLRGQDAIDDAVFVRQLADTLNVAFYLYEIDIVHKAAESGSNIEAVARHERYRAAHDALEKFCRSCNTPISEGRIFTAHNQDDRVENFYMRSIVGTGPGGFRGMRYLNGAIARPCLDVGRQDLRDYLARRELDAQADPRVAIVHDQEGRLWRTDATNAHTDRFRSFVRHNIVPQAQKRNPRHAQTLCRSMNLIADEDDMLQAMAHDALEKSVTWVHVQNGLIDHSRGCVLLPCFAQLARPLQRRTAALVLQSVLGEDARVETASVEAVVDGFGDKAPISGYTVNIQGDLALSANKKGLRIEPMDAYRRRRKHTGESKAHTKVVRIVLASKSPRRSELLSKAGVQFCTMDSHADENLPSETWNDPATAVLLLAKRKAATVARNMAAQNEECLVIGADTVVVLDGTVFGKPCDEQDARDMLQQMSGRAHQVITGVSIWKTQEGSCAPVHEFTETSNVFFKDLSDQDITDYLACGESMDKAGAYAIQGEGHVLVERFEGDYDNIVGLPSSVPRILQSLASDRQVTL